MLLLDPKFRDNKGKYIAQTTLAALVMFFVLDVLDAASNAATIAALGASTFIAFTMPHAQVSRPRYLVGGYAVCIVTGTLCHGMCVWANRTQVPLLHNSSVAVFGAIALGLAVFAMVTMNLEHPPAASLALGLTLGEFSLRTIFVVIVGIVIVATAKTILKPVMVNLL